MEASGGVQIHPEEVFDTFQRGQIFVQAAACKRGAIGFGCAFSIGEIDMAAGFEIRCQTHIQQATLALDEQVVRDARDRRFARATIGGDDTQAAFAFAD